jgi:hypothetical protein
MTTREITNKLNKAAEAINYNKSEFLEIKFSNIKKMTVLESRHLRTTTDTWGLELKPLKSK